MARNEKSGDKVGTIAAKGIKDPGALTNKQIQSLSASVLTQRADQPKAKPTRRS